jgi:hypothetical protein
MLAAYEASEEGEELAKVLLKRRVTQTADSLQGCNNKGRSSRKLSPLR